MLQIKNINYNLHNEIAKLLIDNRTTISDFVNNSEKMDIACLEIA
jgi:hypothetical protein